MWKRFGRFLLLLLVGLSFSSLAFSEEPLSEAEVRAWAETATKSEVTTRLVEAVMLIETLDKRLTTVSAKLRLAEERLTTSVASFEESLAAKNLEIAATTRRLWTARIKWGAGGLLAGAATALAWNILH